MIFVAWISLSVVAAIIGSDRTIGWLTAFVLSILLSPLIGLIFVFASDKKSDVAYRKAVLEQQGIVMPQQEREGLSSGWIVLIVIVVLLFILNQVFN